MNFVAFAIIGMLTAAFASPIASRANGDLFINVTSVDGSTTTQSMGLNEDATFSGRDIQSVEIGGIVPDIERSSVECTPTWHFAESGAIVGLQFRGNEASSPDQIFGNGPVDAFDLICIRSSLNSARDSNAEPRLLTRDDTAATRVDITFQSSDSSSGQVTAPVGIGAGINATGVDIIALQIGAGHNIDASKVICQPIWYFDNQAIAAGSTFRNNASAFLTDLSTGYGRMAADRPRVPRVEIFCNQHSPIHPRDQYLPTVSIMAHDIKDVSRSVQVAIGQGADIAGTNITELTIDGADGVESGTVNCQSIWFVNGGSGQLGYTFNQSSSALPGYFLHGDDSIPRVSVVCA